MDGMGGCANGRENEENFIQLAFNPLGYECLFK